jgi:hypothetical protein
MVPLVVLAAERSWLLHAQTAPARRSFQPASSGRASSTWSTMPGPSHGVGRSASSMRCPPIRVRRPRSGGPAVWCPARPVSSPLVSTRPMPSPSGVQPVRCPAVRCPPRPDASVSSQLMRWHWGPDRCGGHLSPQERVEVPVAAAAPGGSVDGRGGPDAGNAAESRVGQWESVADPGRVVGGGGRA